tara:strand:+ start:4292 stop:4639 length:348 start_codon:yes stop_codon:yes gene_type:complete
MKLKPIFADAIHRVVVEDYITLLDTFVSELTTDSQYNQFCDTVDTIVDYSNNYEGDMEGWLMIMPLHLSVMTSGLFIGIETDDNRGQIRGYKLILDNHLHALAESLSSLKLSENE